MSGAGSKQVAGTPPSPNSLFMSCISRKAGERLARAVRNYEKVTPHAPMATNPWRSTNIGNKELLGESTSCSDMHPCAASCSTVGPTSTQDLGSSQEAHLPLPALFIWESDWIRMQFLDFSRMPSVMLHQNLGLSLSCRKMEPNSTTKSVSSLQLKADQPRRVVR